MKTGIAKQLWDISLSTDISNLDKKHKTINNRAKEISFEKLKRNYRSWEMQSDCDIPFQFNFYSLRSYGLTKYIKYLLAISKNNFIYGMNNSTSFYEDLEIIKLLDGYDILEKCPVHKTPGNTTAFFVSKTVSANPRWLRYIYFSAIVRKYCQFKKDSPVILDIGSFYGGFQYVIKNLIPKSKHILVDFPHQLARSALFLGESFPNSKIYSIHDENSLKKYFSSDLNNKYDFLLLTTDFFHKFSDKYSYANVDLLTNFFSLGEMKEYDFRRYIESKILLNSNQIYFCNRFDSSPFYEPTYESKFSMIDYIIDGYNIKLTQNSGIHNYLMVPRRLFGQRKIRPISSNYFDLILEKIGN